MSAPVPAPRHRRRWISAALIALLLIALTVLGLHVHALLQPQRFTALLKGELASAGLTLKLRAAATPVLFPHPGVKLEGISLGVTGSGTPLLDADAATIVVPWRALLRGDAAIERVDIDSPRVDLGELKVFLARLPRRAGPPRLPTITAGIHLNQGTLAAHGAPMLFSVDVDTGTLAPGRPFHLAASARDQAGRLYSGSLTTVPSAPRAGAIAFDPLTVTLVAAAGLSLQLQGKGTWRGGEDLALMLSGQFRRAPATPAHASAAASGHAPLQVPTAPVADNLQLALTPPHGATPLTISLQLAGPDTHANLTLQPAAVAAWWARVQAATPSPAPLPMPFQGSVKVDRVDLGWLQASGIELEASPEPPATATSTRTPAAAAH